MLVSFTHAINGSMCGNLSASSLAEVQAPASLTMERVLCLCGGVHFRKFVPDVLVGGCRVVGGLFTAISSTQPDQEDPSAPPAGAGGPYLLSGGSDGVITTCRDHDHTVVALSTCLRAAAYSMALRFTADRVIVK